MRYKIILIIIIFIFCLCPQIAGAVNYNPSYPRIGVHLWQATPAWYAQFDLAVIGAGSAEIKALNPDIILSPRQDINKGAGMGYHDEWIVKDKDGKNIKIYGNDDLYNITDIYPPEYSGEKYQDAVIERMAGLAQGFDMLTTDGLWPVPPVTGIDLDQDGHADGQSTVQREWRTGAGKVIAGIRDRISNKPFLINGGVHKSHRDKYNGSYFEYGQPFITDWYNGWGEYASDMRESREPHTIYIDGNSGWGVEETTIFQAMRFGLSTALLGDGYFSYQMGTWHDHFFIGYFDEYDLDLGYPTSAVHKKKCSGEECLFIRFFEKGVNIINVKGEPISVDEDSLKNLPGYDGPYYRFQGGQDTAWNNGEKLTPLTLDGVEIPSDNPHLSKYWGDAIILLKEPLPVIAPIIIDEHHYVTSPGSNKVETTGYWTSSSDIPGNFWRMHNSVDEGTSHLRTNQKEATATFRPTIGVKGKYEVFEWHGDKIGFEESANVSCKIQHAKGSKEITIDQTKNHGQWNSLGTYYFKPGTDGYVKFFHDNEEMMLADAVKFVYQQAELVSDFNCDNKIDIQDFGILLSYWQQRENLNDYQHPQCEQPKSLDLVPDNIINGADIGILLSCWGKPSKEVCYE